MSQANVERHRLALDAFTAEVVDVRDLGRVTVAVVRSRGHGAGSAIPIEQTQWLVVEWRDHKIIRWSTHEAESEALEAARLRE